MRRSRSGEKGAALIAVLALVSTCSVLVAAMVLLGRVHRTEVHTRCAVSASRYAAESAMNRIIWLVTADRELFPDSVPGEEDYDEFSHDRYMADGVIHTMEYMGRTVRFRVEDAVCGLDLSSGASGLEALLTGREDDTAVADALENFGDLITDYMDADDSVTGEGMEADDYEAADSDPLPRNGAWQYREELMWLTDAEKFLPCDRFGRPTGIMLPGIAVTDSRPGLFTATWTELTTLGGLTGTEAALVLEALNRWRRERTPLADSLDGTLYLNLSENFRLEESGVYRVTVEQAAADGEPTAVLGAVFEAYSGAPDGNVLVFREWMFL